MDTFLIRSLAVGPTSVRISTVVTTGRKGMNEPTVVIMLPWCFQVHRLVVVNKHLEVVGVVSLSDILKFLVLSGRKDT